MSVATCFPHCLWWGERAVYQYSLMPLTLLPMRWKEPHASNTASNEVKGLSMNVASCFQHCLWCPPMIEKAICQLHNQIIQLTPQICSSLLEGSLLSSEWWTTAHTRWPPVFSCGTLQHQLFLCVEVWFHCMQWLKAATLTLTLQRVKPTESAWEKNNQDENVSVLDKPC